MFANEQTGALQTGTIRDVRQHHRLATIAQTQLRPGPVVLRDRYSGVHLMKALYHRMQGKVGIPILLWFMGVPGFVVVLLWLLFFRG
jgi:hypothetical protein